MKCLGHYFLFLPSKRELQQSSLRGLRAGGSARGTVLDLALVRAAVTGLRVTSRQALSEPQLLFRRKPRTFELRKMPITSVVALQ